MANFQMLVVACLIKSIWFHHSLFIIHYSPFIIHYLLSLSIIHYPFFSFSFFFSCKRETRERKRKDNSFFHFILSSIQTSLTHFAFPPSFPLPPTKTETTKKPKKPKPKSKKNRIKMNPSPPQPLNPSSFLSLSFLQFIAFSLCFLSLIWF